VKNFLLVFIGGGLGSGVRYAISRWVGLNHSQLFPMATLISNVIACFVLGLVIGMADQKQLLTPTARLFWTVGFCGGFSTFSTFSNETLTLFQQGMQLTSFLYTVMSILICLAAVVAGQFVSRV
jgi:fluoride exporter